MIAEILKVINSQENAVTMRHIAYRTGIAAPTLVGVMMGMLNQGYVMETSSGALLADTIRCTCACCSEKKGEQKTSSLDRRLFRITPRGRQYVKTWVRETDLEEKSDG